MDLPADLQLAGTTSADGGAGPGRSPSWRPLLESGERADAGRPRRGPSWPTAERRAVVDDDRLAYLAEAPVNWCPGLGTVLANEEVTADGRSERGNFPVFKRNLRQWMMRITAYADRLLDDLDALDWPEPVKLMQRNWIGRSHGRAGCASAAADGAAPIEVFTTRPDTLFGATFMVLAPEHPLVDALVPHGAGPRAPRRLDRRRAPRRRDAVAAYRQAAARKTDLERQTEGRDKTGVFTGAYAINPVNGAARSRSSSPTTC